MYIGTNIARSKYYNEMESSTQIAYILQTLSASTESSSTFWMVSSKRHGPTSSSSSWKQIQMTVHIVYTSWVIVQNYIIDITINGVLCYSFTCYIACLFHTRLLITKACLIEWLQSMRNSIALWYCLSSGNFHLVLSRNHMQDLQTCRSGRTVCGSHHKCQTKIYNHQRKS